MLPSIMRKNISSLETRNLGEIQELCKCWGFMFLSVAFVYFNPQNQNDLLQNLLDSTGDNKT